MSPVGRGLCPQVPPLPGPHTRGDGHLRQGRGGLPAVSVGTGLWDSGGLAPGVPHFWGNGAAHAETLGVPENKTGCFPAFCAADRGAGAPDPGSEPSPARFPAPRVLLLPPPPPASPPQLGGLARCRAAFCHLRAVSGRNGTEEAGFALRPRWSGAGGGVPQAVGPHLAPGHVPSAPWGAPPVPQPWVQGCPQSHGGRRRPRRPGLPRPPLTFAGQARATGGAHTPQAEAWRVCIALEEHAPLSRPPPPGGTARRSARSLRARTSGQNLGTRVSEASPLALGSPCSSQPRARA